MIYSSDCSEFSINCVGIAVGIFVGLNVDYLRSCLLWDSVVLRMEFELRDSRTVFFKGGFIKYLISFNLIESTII